MHGIQFWVTSTSLNNGLKLLLWCDIIIKKEQTPTTKLSNDTRLTIVHYSTIKINYIMITHNNKNCLWLFGAWTFYIGLFKNFALPRWLPRRKWRHREIGTKKKRFVSRWKKNEKKVKFKFLQLYKKVMVWRMMRKKRGCHTGKCDPRPLGEGCILSNVVMYSYTGYTWRMLF